jgi:hypothetical protein
VKTGVATTAVAPGVAVAGAVVPGVGSANVLVTVKSTLLEVFVGESNVISFPDAATGVDAVVLTGVSDARRTARSRLGDGAGRAEQTVVEEVAVRRDRVPRGVESEVALRPTVVAGVVHRECRAGWHGTDDDLVDLDVHVLAGRCRRSERGDDKSGDPERSEQLRKHEEGR